MGDSGTRSVTLGAATPLLNVEDAETSLAFYRRMLDFELVSRWPEEGGPVRWARIARGELQLMLNQPEQAESSERRGQTAYSNALLVVLTDDVDALHRQLEQRGAEVEPPTNEMYGRELLLCDPDGYWLSFVES